jgi:hypothetical protein
MTKTKKPYWNSWRIAYIIVVLSLISVGYIYVTTHPEQMSFEPKRLVNTSDGVMYKTNSCGYKLKLEYNNYNCHETLMKPPFAYNIYCYQNKYGKYVSWFGWIVLIGWIAINFKRIKERFKGLRI